jgi:hypothetical protein
MNTQAAIILTKTKNMALAVILTILFGGLGLFYASIVGGIVMTVLEIIIVIAGFVTVGIAWLLIPLLHIINLIWAIVAVKKHNARIIAAAGSGS